MKKKVLTTICCVLFISVCAMGQDGWGNYQPRTLNQIIKQHAGLVIFERPPAQLIFNGDPLPSKVKVTYTAKVRKITPTRKAFILDWCKSQRLSEESGAVFEEELLFKEGDVEYWLPVQKQVIPHFKEELKPGEEVKLYVIWIGGRQESGVPDWVFLVNEFEKYQPSRSATLSCF
jgi:hypothetical protein